MHLAAEEEGVKSWHPATHVILSVRFACNISQGNGLAFLRRDNRIHGGCLAAAQRRAQTPSSRDARAGEAEVMPESKPTFQGQSTRGSHE
jgi:hypothetical protein